MKWRSEVAVVLMVTGALAPVRLVAAQQTAPAPDPECACYEKPGEPGEPGGNTGRLALFGIAGLAVLSGLPFGATSLQGLPFAAAPMPAPALQVATPESPVDAPASPQQLAAAPTRTPGPVAAARTPDALVLPEIERAGVVPPRTATHLPLLAAVGVLMVGGGGVLARRKAQQLKNKRRRFVAF